LTAFGSLVYAILSTSYLTTLIASSSGI
jgi:hypothetical protein